MADTHVTLTIEGVAVSVPRGTTILEAAKQAGVLIPHYCYHPGLPIAGVCRMCLVEIEGQPKLQIACAATAAASPLSARPAKAVRSRCRYHARKAGEFADGGAESVRLS